MMRQFVTIGVAVGSLLSTACVSTGAYREAVERADQARLELDRTKRADAKVIEDLRRIAAEEKRAYTTMARAAQTDREAAELFETSNETRMAAVAMLQRTLEETEAHEAKLRAALAKRGVDPDKVLLSPP
jgi:uncharacterized protein YdiU (UPF0061 family)